MSTAESEAEPKDELSALCHSWCPQGTGIQSAEQASAAPK